MSESVTITHVDFHNFKAFTQYSLSLQQQMNILVGPNNAGKSTILGACRVLAAGLRRANSKNADVVSGPNGATYGYIVPTDDLPISLENAQTDYRDDVTTTVVFHLSNGRDLTLYFPNDGGAILIPSHSARSRRTASAFKTDFPIKIEAIPVLGPLEHKEEMVEKRTVLRGLVTHRASRHFRNYWHYFPESFDSFAAMISETWPGMEVKPPEFIDYQFFAMFCKEGMMDRELYWAGFGFQIWCQLLTHIVRARDANLLVVDEPEIYLHPDLQRRLLPILREAGPDILLATHSTEMVSEAEPSEILLVQKSKRSAQRIKSIDQVQTAIDILGSNQNITLTQLARTQRVLFVEGNDFKILGRLAHQLGLNELASKFDFTVVPVGGFSHWGNVKAFAWGIEKILGMPLMLGAIFDRDYRSDEEVNAIAAELQAHLKLAHIHRRKEIENYLLVPSTLDRAIHDRLTDYARRRSIAPSEAEPVAEILDKITTSMKAEILGQYISERTGYLKASGFHQSTIAKETIESLEGKWSNIETRMEVVPGKIVFSELNKHLTDHYHVSLTPVAVISHLKREEIPRDIVMLLRGIDKFRKLQA